MPEKPPTPKAGSARSGRRWLSLFYALPVLFVLGICSYMAFRSASHQKLPVRKISANPFVTVKIADLDAHLFTQGDALRASGSDMFLEFRDAQGKLAEVGEVTFELVLKMPDAVMHSIGKVMHTATPGQYRTSVQPGMAGEWTATLGYSGPRGQTETNFSVKVM